MEVEDKFVLEIVEEKKGDLSLEFPWCWPVKLLN